MKLGEALSLRARQAQKLNDLKGRIKANALAQEGTQAPEDAQALIAEYEQLSGEHAELVFRITTTNADTIIDGVHLQQMLQDRESLTRIRNIYATAADAASSSSGVAAMRYMRSELKYEPMVDVPTLRRLEDDTTEKIRVLDADIQRANWQTDLY